MSDAVRAMEQERGAALNAAKDALDRWLDTDPPLNGRLLHAQYWALLDLMATAMQAYRSEQTAEGARLLAAVEAIHREGGQVCAAFPQCPHDICQSSHAAWAIADRALRGAPR